MSSSTRSWTESISLVQPLLRMPPKRSSQNRSDGTAAEAPPLKRPAPEADPVLAAVRLSLRQQDADAFVLSTSDPHQSEYVSAHDALLPFVSGFTGSESQVGVGKQLMVSQARRAPWSSPRPRHCSGPTAATSSRPSRSSPRSGP